MKLSTWESARARSWNGVLSSGCLKWGTAISVMLLPLLTHSCAFPRKRHPLGGRSAFLRKRAPSSASRVPRGQYLPRGVASGNTHDPASRMTSCPAQEQTLERRAVLGGSRNRTNHQELIEGQVPVVPVAAADAKLLLHIGRRQQLRTDDAAAQTGGKSFQRVQCRVREALPAAVPTLLERIRRVLHDGRQHMLSGRRQRGVIDGRNGDFHDGCRRKLTVLRVIVRVLDVPE